VLSSADLNDALFDQLGDAAPDGVRVDASHGCCTSHRHPELTRLVVGPAKGNAEH
jgi:hypothetical protein